MSLRGVLWRDSVCFRSLAAFRARADDKYIYIYIYTYTHIYIHTSHSDPTFRKGGAVETVCSDLYDVIY